MTCAACHQPTGTRVRFSRCGWTLCADCFADKSAAELDGLGLTWDAREGGAA